MTKRRLYTLAGGVAVLASISWWRLSGDGPPLPSEPSRGSPPATAGPERQEDISSFSGHTMGTTYTVKYVAPDAGAQDVLQAATDAALVAVNASMSTYDPKSEISLLNRTTFDTPLPLSESLNEVVTLAAQVHRESEGAFDITVGPLVSAFGFGPARATAPADEESLNQLRKTVGMDLLILDPKKRTLRKTLPEIQLDLGGIAKGYGVDQVASALEALGVKSYMVEVGGEIRVQGLKPDGTAWLLAIEEPVAGERRVHATLSLPESGAALATSGDYRNFRKVGEKVVSHTFDPRTKAPVARRTASVSVVRPTAAEADAWATAMTVLPPEKAVEIANAQGIPVYILTHKKGGGFDSHQSNPWKALAMKTR